MVFNILIIDDEKDIRDLVSGILQDEGYTTSVAGTCVEALEAIREREPHLIILDVWLGDSDRDGLRLLDVIKNEHQFVPVIMISGHATIETAVNAIKYGAYDFIEKPFDASRLLLSIKKAMEATMLKKENERLKIKARMTDSVIGISNAINNLKNEIKKVSQMRGRCFLCGPAGADKEGIAREIFRMSNSYNLSFTTINCQTSNQRQLEVDIFGAEIKTNEQLITKVGAWEKTNGGTIYFEEISALSKDLQTKVLKVIQEEKINRIGGTKKIPIETRIISSSSLKTEALLRGDILNSVLYYRLSANVVKIPPLSTRQEDIPLLLNYYMNQSAQAHNLPQKKFTEEALSLLKTYFWPGDVMQLRNLVDWVLVMHYHSDSDGETSGAIDVQDLPKEITEGKSFGGNSNAQFISFVSKLSIKEAREAFEREYFIEQLRKFSGNVSQTSKFVGMERSALHRKLKLLNIHDTRAGGSKEKQKGYT
jgi:two-component system nitrogen regulation response regulator NtrX